MYTILALSDFSKIRNLIITEFCNDYISNFTEILKSLTARIVYITTFSQLSLISFIVGKFRGGPSVQFDPSLLI